MSQRFLTNQIPPFEFSYTVITGCKIKCRNESWLTRKSLPLITLPLSASSCRYGDVDGKRSASRSLTLVSSRFPAIAKARLCSSQFSLISCEAWMVSIPPSSSLSSLPFFSGRALSSAPHKHEFICVHMRTRFELASTPFCTTGGIKTNMFSEAAVAELRVTLAGPRNYRLPSCRKR